MPNALLRDESGAPLGYREVSKEDCAYGRHVLGPNDVPFWYAGTDHGEPVFKRGEEFKRGR